MLIAARALEGSVGWCEIVRPPAPPPNRLQGEMISLTRDMRRVMSWMRGGLGVNDERALADHSAQGLLSASPRAPRRHVGMQSGFDGMPDAYRDRGR